MTDTFTIPQTVERWGVTRQRIYQLLAQGRITPVSYNPIRLAADVQKPAPSQRRRGKGKANNTP